MEEIVKNISNQCYIFKNIDTKIQCISQLFCFVCTSNPYRILFPSGCHLFLEEQQQQKNPEDTAFVQMHPAMKDCLFVYPKGQSKLLLLFILLP